MDPFVGEIRLFSFGRIPTGWLACQGQILVITQFQALYALLGNRYGGDGKVNFALPDLRGRVPVHQGTSPISGSIYQIAQAGGTETVTLTTNQLPPHNHLIEVSNAPGTLATVGPAVYLAQIATPATPAGAPAAPAMFVPPNPGAQTAVTLLPEGIAATGGSSGHENRQPYLPMNYCIATTGLFPQRN